ncbi:TonB-dependent siderophore receptor [Paraglaciecola sp. L3A3]|uniref:TonB-dependent receptor n=1 Tax=Paraglaciecola sp. L3A3 TaxID=2686358 RepID=UPI00131CB9DD|nr:TonB-dependent receptor [Paraglaciecola sp. L3A3]
MSISTHCILISASLMVSLTVDAQQQNNNVENDSVEYITVTGAAQPSLVMSPKDSIVDGPFGKDKNLTEIARSLTSISSDMLEQLSIDDLQDVLTLVPNTYSASGFGAPSLPTIRGQLGELFQQGMRRQAGNNGFGIPLSFNSVGQIDVVKGAPSVILGTSQRNGGFVNLNNKVPTLTGTDIKLQANAGSWAHYRGQIDISTAITENKSGIRVSAEYIDNDSYYDFSQFQSEDLFVAYKVLPDDQSSWDISFEYYKVDFTDNAGINRPTQNLIDKGLYITGQGVQPNSSTVPGAFSLVSPTGEVPIPRSTVLTDPDNINNAQTYVVHSTYERQLNSVHSLTNRSYFQYLDREEIAQNSFVEIIDGAKTAQNRFEIHSNWSTEQQTTWGLDLRYNNVLGYSQFTTEADLPIDLMGNIEQRRIPLTAAQQARLVELRPDVFVSPGANYDIDNDGSNDFSLSDTTDSTSWQTGLFAEQESNWNNRFSTTVGIRADHYDVTARDALPPQGQIAAQDDFSKWLYAGSASARFSINDDMVSYATYSYSEATSNSMAGGTVLAADNKINPLNFATQNELYELGIKYAPAQSPWYIDASVFEQSRSLRNRDGSNTGIIAKGFEAQMFYQDDKLWANLGYSYLDARYDDSASSQDSQQVADAFDNSRPDIIQGTGLGAPNFAGFAASNQRVQGLPQQTVSASAGYQILENWDVSGSAIYSKSYPLDYLATVFIRDQITINLNTSVALNEQSNLRFEVRNLTDEKNWRPVFEGGYFGSTLVFPELPRSVQLTYTYNFRA